MNRMLLTLGVCFCISTPVFCDDVVPNVRCEVDRSVKSLTQPEAEAFRSGNRAFNSLVTELIEKSGPPEKPRELPDISKAKVVDWEQAKRMVWNALVTTVIQNHDRTVFLVSTSGRAYRTTEPRNGDIMRVAALVDPCHTYITYILE